jgi:hypothetical protein
MGSSGVSLSPPAIVTEFCAKGSLFDVLRKANDPRAPPLDWVRRLQLAAGAARGMHYLHMQVVLDMKFVRQIFFSDMPDMLM